MPGPTPKNRKTKQRRNQEPTAASLIDQSPLAEGKKPDLPDLRDENGNVVPWREEVKDWWADVWDSPMATEYTQADVHGLVLLAELIDRYKRKPSVALAAEIRLQRQCFGLSPIDRRRLQWEIKRAAPAEPPKPKRPERTDDPRARIRAV